MIKPLGIVSVDYSYMPFYNSLRVHSFYSVHISIRQTIENSVWFPVRRSVYDSVRSSIRRTIEKEMKC